MIYRRARRHRWEQSRARTKKGGEKPGSKWTRRPKEAKQTNRSSASLGTNISRPFLNSTQRCTHPRPSVRSWGALVDTRALSAARASLVTVQRVKAPGLSRCSHSKRYRGGGAAILRLSPHPPGPITQWDFPPLPPPPPELLNAPCLLWERSAEGSSRADRKTPELYALFPPSPPPASRAHYHHHHHHKLRPLHHSHFCDSLLGFPARTPQPAREKGRTRHGIAGQRVPPLCACCTAAEWVAL